MNIKSPPPATQLITNTKGTGYTVIKGIKAAKATEVDTISFTWAPDSKHAATDKLVIEVWTPKAGKTPEKLVATITMTLVNGMFDWDVAGLFKSDVNVVKTGNTYTFTIKSLQAGTKYMLQMQASQETSLSKMFKTSASTKKYTAVSGLKANAKVAKIDSVTFNWTLNQKTLDNHVLDGTDRFVVKVFDPTIKKYPPVIATITLGFSKDGGFTLESIEHHDKNVSSSYAGAIGNINVVTVGAGIASGKNTMYSFQITGLLGGTKYALEAVAQSTNKGVEAKMVKVSVSTLNYPAVKGLKVINSADVLTLTWGLPTLPQTRIADYVDAYNDFIIRLNGEVIGTADRSNAGYDGKITVAIPKTGLLFMLGKNTLTVQAVVKIGDDIVNLSKSASVTSR